MSNEQGWIIAFGVFMLMGTFAFPNTFEAIWGILFGLLIIFLIVFHTKEGIEERKIKKARQNKEG